jgi:cellulose synthase/poly-beta-1,6-N-acetylglucosamine synthase-like glycosyltransferase
MIGFDPAKKINAVEEFGGAALYRRSALKQVGGFNPYIYSYEEPELCARLRHAGFDLAILPEQISEHYGLPEHSLASYWRRWNSQLWIGCGQMLRYHFGKDTFAAVARLQGGRYLLLNFAAALGVLFFLLLGVTLQNPWLVLPGFAGMVIFLAMLLYRKQSIPRALLSLLLRVLILLSGIKGFLMSPVNPATYPTEIETIKATPHTGAVQGETRD